MKAAALFLVTHGSSDRRSWKALQNLVTVARSQSDRYIGGGCLEGQELSLSQQLEQFAIEVIRVGISEIAILPLFLLEGVHVSDDIPEQVAIAQSNLPKMFPELLPNKFVFRTMAHLGTAFQIPNILLQHFEKYTEHSNLEKQGRILMSHGSRRAEANQVVEDLATHSQAIAAYWGVEPKIETQIEHLISQGINKVTVLPYFLSEGGITEAIANKLKAYSDLIQIQQLPVPLLNEQIVDLALKFA
ncbi:MAG: sirohydrochlorin chelatase [Pseudanabaena sp.]|jgi:sirohydrochlorin ferrochelatase